ncbi:Spo0E family sporulation regulatory protein-aspartic acid phosphatase [Neobacillus sp. NPDC093127]|uniref:Spo0E family sporulation regulatory protein-aspartic acid phosphatase n=1 Tax=Neobacillus sp. NPDC093127 TaxID=3364296 RepID=UPI00381DBBB3
MTYLLMMIENYRNELFELAEQYGPTAAETIECSQQLDRLLNLLIALEQNQQLISRRSVR